MGIDNGRVLALKRERARLFAEGQDVSELDDEIAAARGDDDSSGKKTRKRAAEGYEAPVTEASVSEKTSASKSSK